MLQKVKSLIEDDYKLGLELIACRRLVKGYGDTHARGSSKFDRLMGAAVLLKGRPEAAGIWLRCGRQRWRMRRGCS